LDQEMIIADELDLETLNASTPDDSSLAIQIAQLRMILEVSRSLNSTLDLDTLLDLIIQVATEATGTEVASLLLLDEKTGELHFEAATSTNRSELKAMPVPLEGSIAGWIFRHNQALVVNDTLQDPRYYSRVARMTQFETRSILGAPLRVKDRTIGVLEVLNKRGDSPFTGQDVETLETLAAQAAIAIENARLYKDLQDQMQTVQEAQARLVQSEKLAAVGELVAGVAHELNNPLTSIIGFAHILQRSNPDDQSQKDLEKILAQARRASGIVRGLLDFARQRPPEQKPVQINAVLNSTLELMAYELRTHNIEWSANFSPDLPLTMADPYQLQQVFVNLVNNAHQAMSETHRGGHLTVTTQLGPSTFIQRQNETGPVIRVIIQDDGPGIPPELLPSVFDPFFTTKSVGQGTGLGLSVCHGIVSEHGGHIWAESESGQGATLFVEFPVVAPEMPSQPDDINRSLRLPAAPPGETASNSASRILLVDDEVDLLDLLIRALRSGGYQVDAVSDGEAALARLAETDYRLIICDIRMPGLSGPQLYRRVQERDPDLAQRFMFITGDTVGSATSRFFEETGAPYLCKPFGPADLIKKLSELLREKT
jgi:signal transduction histidine kinase/ActR/RegA family two-component response regulator